VLDFTVTFLVTLVNLAVLFFVLKGLLFKPLTRFMAERAKRIETSVREANQAKERAELARTQYEELLRMAEKEGEGILRDAEARGAVRYGQIVAEAEAAGKEIREQQENKLNRELAKAKEDFTGEIAAIAMLAAAKAAGRELNEKDSGRFSEDFVRKIVKGDKA
jgi:F-type H+-transporting ATPase subunit b